ncbi:MAG TPA: hypothetical protein VM324_07480 [Egibacteraceae bacterium]|jgi:hypothetical protein|nr:hypothetical protein [Egibacteraceae bacterium]
MHGLLSRDGMPPSLLLAAGRDEMRGYGGEVSTDAVKCHRPHHRAGRVGVEAVGGHVVDLRR